MTLTRASCGYKDPSVGLALVENSTAISLA